MALKKYAELTKTKWLMTEAGIDLNAVLRDGITENGYEEVVFNENGKILRFDDEVVTNFVDWPDAEVGRHIWETYKREAGL